jgi:regulator of PEP synthase PpsR (kinase-PPPase family)
MGEFHIFVVSDGTGETATKMSKAAILQFKSANTVITRFSNIRSMDAVRDMLRDAERLRALVIHTFAAQDLRFAFEEACQDRNVPTVDLLGVLLDKLEDFLGIAPTGKPGLLHQVDDGYFERLDALAFTVRHDDNLSPEDLGQADIILVGVSRTSKTPLSVYLAQEGWKVANIPVVMGDELPPELFRVKQSKIVGLTTSAERLAEVRKARLSRVGGQDSSYADLVRVRQELEHCNAIFDRNPEWVRVDVTGKSVEETAAEILDRLFGKERPL